VKRSACFLFCAVCLAGRAGANDIRIFFGQPESVPPTTAFVPEAHLGESAPPGTYTLGIWAEIQADLSGPNPGMDVWDYIVARFAYTGAPVTIPFPIQDNFDHDLTFLGTAYRWEDDVQYELPMIWLTAGTRYGLGGLYPREFGMGVHCTDWWSYTIGTPGEPDARYRYWLGNITLSSAGPAQVWFANPYISRQGGDPTTDRIYLGETDPVPWDPASPEPWGYMPDFVFTPEPRSLVLMVLAGWLVRRR
jgi:hypothetical protein